MTTGTTLYDTLAREAARLLEQLIRIPGTSRNEDEKADFLQQYLAEHGANPRREGNNLWCEQPDRGSECPTLLLNAHIDTVKPASGWQRNPYQPLWEGDRLYALCSNACGGGLTTVRQVF